MKTLNYLLLTLLISHTFVVRSQSTGSKPTNSFIEKILADHSLSVSDVKDTTIGISNASPAERIYLKNIGSIWQQESKNIFEYNDRELLSKNIFLFMDQNAMRYDTSFSLEYNYDQNQFVKEITRKNYFNKTWHYNTKETFGYNTSGNLIEHLVYRWTGSNWILFSGTRKEYVLNNNDLYYITWINYDKDQNQWQAVQQSMVVYDQGLPATLFIYDINNSIYNEKYKFNLHWKDFSKELLDSVKIEEWEINTWKPTGKISYQYLNDDPVYLLRNHYLLQTDFYFNYGYSLEGDIVQLTMDLYQWGSSTGIQNNAGFKKFIHYDQQNRAYTEFVENYDSLSGLWIDNEKFEFIYPQVTTGTPMIGKDKINVNIYPNPAKNILTISTTGFESETISVTIFDIIGKEVLRNEYSISEIIRLDISTLKSGNYIISINAEAFSKTMKIVKH